MQRQNLIKQADVDIKGQVVLIQRGRKKRRKEIPGNDPAKARAGEKMTTARCSNWV
jgi:hypothetical protein